MQTLIEQTAGRVSFLTTHISELHIAVLIALVGIATVFDIREHRIPNWLVAGGAVYAVVYHSVLPAGQGAVFTLAGLAVGMSALLPLYALGTMGAGDVKLMGMVGAYLGYTATINAILATLVAGGVLALLASAYKRALPQLIDNLYTMIVQRHIRQMGGAGAGSAQPRASVGKLPYAVAIAAGTACQVFWLHH